MVKYFDCHPKINEHNRKNMINLIQLNKLIKKSSPTRFYMIFCNILLFASSEAYLLIMCIDKI